VGVLLLIGACSRPIDAARSEMPSRLTVLVQEGHWFYYKSETGHWEGFNHELIDRMQRHVSVPVEIKSFATYDELLEAFEAGQGDIMCPAIAIERDAPDPTIATVFEQQQFPALRFKVSDDEDFVWVLRQDLAHVAAHLDDWTRTVHSQLFVANLYVKYFAHLGLLNKFDLVMLKVRYRRDLPRYRRLFNEAGRRHDIDPLFIAAMSYQESHWDPEATSFTGVRGLMMLTQETAAEIGVTDRLDPRQSIFGGTKYFTQLRKQLDEEIGRPDNSYFALAAYNVGLGHVEDAQEVVRRNGQDHTSWSHLRDALPLLADPRVYTTLKYGKARGREPVRYVDSIRNYYSLMSRWEAERDRSRGGA
jgi:membrane-bound lytic murein transglycosylase MltF